MNDALDELERRVGEKWVVAAAARTPRWDVPEFDVDWSAWFGTLLTQDQQLADVPRFPRGQWASYPNARTTVLLVCDHLLDQTLTDEQWMTVCLYMQYGGKTRLG